jgi:RHS repeat-associated protein
VPVHLFAFTGREWDADAGLYYYRARWYDAAPGRFLSQDPLGLRPDPNPYRYVGNSPTNATDPSGLYNASGHFYTTYLVAIVAGLSSDEAYRLAYYSQLPDQDAEFSATGQWSGQQGNLMAHGVLGGGQPAPPPVVSWFTGNWNVGEQG